MKGVTPGLLTNMGLDEFKLSKGKYFIAYLAVASVTKKV